MARRPYPPRGLSAPADAGLEGSAVVSHPLGTVARMVTTRSSPSSASAAIVGVALVVGRSPRPLRQPPKPTPALAAALDQQAPSCSARLGLEREHTVNAAADMAARMAGEKLGDTLATGGKHLDLRAEAFDQKVAGIDLQLQRMGDLMASLKQEGAEPSTAS